MTLVVAEFRLLINWSFGTFDIDFTILETFDKVSLAMGAINFMAFDEVMFDKEIHPLNYWFARVFWNKNDEVFWSLVRLTSLYLNLSYEAPHPFRLLSKIVHFGLPNLFRFSFGPPRLFCLKLWPTCSKGWLPLTDSAVKMFASQSV